MMKKIFIALLMAVSTKICLAGGYVLANGIKKTASDIGVLSIRGFLFGESSGENCNK